MYQGICEAFPLTSLHRFLQFNMSAQAKLTPPLCRMPSSQ
jgi:hypothetical protein